MRHSTLDLTMNTYTDPRLLDVAGAPDVLPELPIENDETGQQEMRACVGAPSPIDNMPVHPARNLALTGDSGRQLSSSIGKTTGNEEVREVTNTSRASDARGVSKTPVAATVTRSQRKRANGLEPSTISLEG